MKKEHTQRGFGIIEFTDRYGIDCSLQKSSLATEDAIWFGVTNANAKKCVYGQGWKPIALHDIEESDEISISTRMHLTQEQVAELLPHLIKFVETGEI